MTDNDKTVLIDEIDFFATDETVKLPLTDRYWVRLKRQLDYGEQSELEGSLIRGMTSDQVERSMERGGDLLVTDFGRVKLLRMALYIDEWNLPGKNGATVRLPARIDERIKVIRSLNPKWAAKIVAKIDELSIDEAAGEDEESDDPKPSGEEPEGASTS